MMKTSDALNVGSLVCVSVSMASVIQILQIIMLVISIGMTLLSVILKIKNHELTLDDVTSVKKDIDETVDKIDKINKGDKDE